MQTVDCANPSFGMWLGGVLEIAPRGQETQGRQSCLLAHAAPAGLFPLAR